MGKSGFFVRKKNQLIERPRAIKIVGPHSCGVEILAAEAPVERCQEGLSGWHVTAHAKLSMVCGPQRRSSREKI